MTFENQILRIKRRVWIHTVVNATIFGTVLFLCLHGVAIGIDLWTESSFANQFWFPKLAVGGSLGCCIILAVLKKRRLLDILIEIDRRLNLNDSVSTAFEYQHLGKRTELSQLLIHNATQNLSQLSNRKLFPPRFSWLHLFLVIIILINLLIAFKEREFAQTKPAVVSSNMIQSLDTYLHKQMIHKKKPREYSRSSLRKKIYEDLEKLSQNLKRSPVSRDYMASSVGRMLKEIESGQTMVAKELGEQLKLHNIEDIPVQARQQFEKWSLANIKQLQMMIDRMFDHQVPKTISDRLAILQEQQQLKDVLDNLLDDLDDPESLGRTKNNSNRDKKSGRSRSGSGLNRGEDASQDPFGNQALYDSDTADAQRDEWSDFGGERGQGDESGIGDGDASDDNFSPSAGRGKADGSGKSPKPIDSAKGTALQDRSLLSTKDYYRAHIRTLTSIGQAKLDNQKIIREYQKEVEGILRKEEIPLNYREYIRNYFLSIGLRKEK